MLAIQQATLDAVRAGRVMSRQIKLNRAALPEPLRAQVDALLTTIGGTWSEPHGAYLFRCHPHVAIGRALMNDTITILPSP